MDDERPPLSPQKKERRRPLGEAREIGGDECAIGPPTERVEKAFGGLATRAHTNRPRMATRNDVTFETERLVLREPRAGDALLLSDYYARNAARFERWEPARSADVAVHAAWIAAVRADADRTGHAAAFLAFDRNAPTSLAGTVNLDGFGAAHASAMLSYGVDAVYEGRGIASEAVARIVRYAFDEIRIRTLSAYYDPANARSERLLVRLGFTLAGRTPVVPGLEHLMRSSAIAVLARS